MPNSRATATTPPDFLDGADGEGGKKEMCPGVFLLLRNTGLWPAGLGYRPKALAGLNSWLGSNFFYISACLTPFTVQISYQFIIVIRCVTCTTRETRVRF